MHKWPRMSKCIRLRGRGATTDFFILFLYIKSVYLFYYFRTAPLCALSGPFLLLSALQLSLSVSWTSFHYRSLWLSHSGFLSTFWSVFLDLRILFCILAHLLNGLQHLANSFIFVLFHISFYYYCWDFDVYSLDMTVFTFIYFCFLFLSFLSSLVLSHWHCILLLISTLVLFWFLAFGIYTCVDRFGI